MQSYGTRESFYVYVDEVMNATYSKPLSFSHNCHELTQVNMAHADNFVSILVSDLDYNTDKQAKAYMVANDTPSTTNVEILVADPTDDFTMEEVKSKKIFSHFINPVTDPKSHA